MQDIHDIRPPVSVGLDPMLIIIALAVLGGLLLIAGLFWGYKKWRSKKGQGTGLAEIAPPLPPYEAALNSLDLLLSRPESDPRIFYFDLTLVLRKYMGDSFGAHAAEMTSQEFIALLRKLKFNDSVKQEMIEFSRACDPYKYAGTMPEAGRVKTDIERVREMISSVEAELKAKSEAAEKKEGQ